MVYGFVQISYLPEQILITGEERLSLQLPQCCVLSVTLNICVMYHGAE